MFYPSYILINREPFISLIPGKGQVSIMGIYITEEIPGGINKGIHGIYLASSSATTGRTACVNKVLYLAKG